ncbi:transmembrane protein 232 [Chanos chanos]|uniref:Transmembrane protein 232 n=1 Tax=Chanos chanos TaxID=29144 RepID=A0A6J2UWJ0_CHACN|nr:transmembrane protein 232 [Chanos chanos]
MPIFNVPVTHCLGIISQTCQRDLQKRLFERKEGRNEMAQKKTVIARCQERRAGLRSMGVGPNVELPRAWIDLLSLGLSCDKIQNESLDALLMSLDQAPVLEDQIPALFFLAESVLLQMCNDTSRKSRLYHDIKILKIGYMVFLRLFLFHMLGNLKGLLQSSRLLSECEACYQPFPDLSFAVHFMLQVGEIVFGLKTSNEGSFEIQMDVQGYEVSPLLWHCLLSWYCVDNSISQPSQVVNHLISLKDSLQQDNWVETGLGLMILGEAAKSSMVCLDILMNFHMAQGQETEGLDEKRLVSHGTSWPWQLEHLYCMVLANICQSSSNAEIKKKALVGKPNSSGLGSSGGLLSVLRQTPPGSNGTRLMLAALKGRGDWRVRCSAMQALVHVCRGPIHQDGLRNAAWLALQDSLHQETDRRVVDAIEFSVPGGMVHDEGLSCPWSRGKAAGQTKPSQQVPSPVKLKSKSPLSTFRAQTSTGVNGHCRFVTTQSEATKQNAYTDFKTRADTELMKIVQDQWQKELQIKMAEEEAIEKEELAKAMKEEEDKFQEIMRKRMEKLKKDTKPYELSRYEKPALNYKTSV